MPEEQFEIGLKCRKEVLGEDYVEKSLGNADDFNRDFQRMITEHCWGGSWGRGVLAKRDRSILNLGMLAAANRPHEFKLHLRGALSNGIALTELREILIQIHHIHPEKCRLCSRSLQKSQKIATIHAIFADIDFEAL